MLQFRLLMPYKLDFVSYSFDMPLVPYTACLNKVIKRVAAKDQSASPLRGPLTSGLR